MNNMGDRIRDLRIQKGYTMEELGEIIGVQKSAVNKWEKGAVTNIKRSVIQKMCVLFDVSPSYLMGWEDSLESANTDIITDIAIDKAKQDIVEKLFSLSESDYDMVCAMINRCAKEEGTT